uniref:EGF-like domain-containing protein n=1 Tax=Chromera velia CCMP2878 TaxID=1169474 RepID=A0A0G4IG18_9ALVE|eukprot:Cvel_131.t1-p1 / transcript=Cvel_131.t1 / gene=Cvel_131 / organism=Chromera_velia_CCMP2878 / gene_product=Fibrillin-1, putative / transcript_product=Fibrillin-1, putative / location=Cvel_scaffold9:107513-140936(-) / protein_length=3411 / sequence_SO=supercontig / SO=protein_coding / is_pseudo=false
MKINDRANTIPPSDIGQGNTWTKDPSVPYKGVLSLYKDYSGSVCAGRYRVRSNFDWYNHNDDTTFDANEWPPSGAFDGLNIPTSGNADGRGFHTTASLMVADYSTDAAEDATFHLILEIPCSISVSAYAMTVRADACCAGQGVSKAAVYGSNDMSAWTLVRSHSGETSWTPGETKTWTADETKGPFKFFKFELKKHGYTASGAASVGDISLTQWTAAFPPTDIGQGNTWTKDVSVLYAGLLSLYKDYSGTVCAGRYRVRSNDGWYNYADNSTFDANEWPPSGAFDSLNIPTSGNAEGKGFHATSVQTAYGTDVAEDATFHLILEVPCTVTVSAYAMTVRPDAWCAYQGISKAAVYGSNDMSAWTLVGSHSGETSWTPGETKAWTADETKGPFSFFKFELKKFSQGPAGTPSIGDISLTTTSWTAPVQVPPSGIGRGSTWTKDPSVLYNGLLSLYKDHTGGVCPGRYRVRSNTQWNGNSDNSSFGFSEWPPSSAFDHFPGLNGNNGGFTVAALQVNSGTDSSPDADLHLILELPCRIALQTYGMTIRGDTCCPYQGVSKMTVYGSNDMSTWTEVGAYSGEVGYTAGESRTFHANKAKGAFSFFKFDLQKINYGPDNSPSLGDIPLFANSWTGVTPPTGIGNANTWTKDSSVTYNSFLSLYKDHHGPVCPGRFRVRSNYDWKHRATAPGFSTDEWPLSGAFDHVIGGANMAAAYRPETNTLTNSGTSSGSDADLYLILEMPCSTSLASFGMSSRPDGYTEQSVSKMTVYGSHDMSTWTQVGGYSGETFWSTGETKTFSADPALGSFAFYKFALQKVSGTSDGILAVGEIPLFASSSATSLTRNSGPDSDIYVILQTPCFIRLASFAYRHRNSAANPEQAASKLAVYGAAGRATSSGWNLLGGFSGETSWTQGETRTFSTDSTLGPFDHFKFVVQRIDSGAASGVIAVGDIVLSASEISELEPIPPTDIGSATTWTKDSTVTYNGIDTMHTDYTGAVCPGTYRAKANMEWYEYIAGSSAFSSNEWPVAGAFDWQLANDNTRTGLTVATIANSGVGSATDASFEAVLETPCVMKVGSFGATLRDAGSDQTTQAPYRMTLSGSAGGTTWTELGSFSGESGWQNGETRTYSADNTLGPFNQFKFQVKKVNANSDGALGLADLSLFASSWTNDQIIRPVDMGNATEWKKDPSDTYNGLPSIYKDYTGSVCSGRYRVKTNVDWWPASKSWYWYDSNEWPPNGLFDKVNGVSYRVSGYSTVADVANSGQSSAGDANLEILLQTPCSFILSAFEIEGRVEADAPIRIPVKGTVYGSTDGGAWTKVASYLEEMGWGPVATKTFDADSTLGPFNHFKFDSHKVTETNDAYIAFGELQLFATNVTDPCGDGTANCHANATCENVGSSFTCSCDYGFSGDGISCSSLTLVPPADIGASNTWTKDSTVTYSSLPTFLKTYTGAVCPGTYRAKSNATWYGHVGASFASDEWAPSGVFDRKPALGAQTGYSSPANVLNSGTDAGTDANLEILLELPCSIRLQSYAIQARGDTTMEAGAVPSKAVVYGSTDGSTWTQIGSYANQIHWSAGVTKGFLTSSSTDYFSHFEFLFQKRSTAADGWILIGDIELYAANWGVLISSADIGTAATWTKDPSVTYNNIPSMYTDYNGTVCPGKFRATTNEVHFGDGGWYSTSDPWFVAGAFDGQPLATHGSGTGYCTASSSVSGYADAGESNVELILQTPCSVHLKEYGITSRNDNNAPDLSPSKMIVYGSADGSSWTQIGSFTNETSWTQGERKNFAADSTLSPFNYFKFDSRRISKADSYYLCFGELHLLASSVTDLCTLSAHNCDANATCANSGSSFTCTCNSGFTGDGVSCSTLTLVPPADIGRGDTWIKDSTVTHNSVYTLYKDYSGSVCSGRYRAKANVAWKNDAGSGGGFDSNEWPISGAFDGVGGATQQTSAFAPDVPQSGTDAASDADIELILQTPCLLEMHEYAIQARQDGSETQTPSKMSVSGSLDCTGTWTELGSFEGEINWSVAETRIFSANSTLGAFNCFFFTAKRVSEAADGTMSIGDIKLYGFEVVQIPPSDIGPATTWTKDSSVLFSGLYTQYKDYTGSVCPGRYRAMTNTDWFDNASNSSYSTNEWPPSGAFDKAVGATNAVAGFHTDSPVLNSGTSSGTDANVELVLRTPCSFTLHKYDVQARSGGNPANTTPTKVTVSESVDGSSWTEIGSYSGESGWTAAELRSFDVSVVSLTGPFNYFKFDFNKLASSTDASMILSEIALFGLPLDLCGDGAHNCNASATCTNAGDSFTCSCNGGFIGDGVSCSAPPQIPPADIGAGNTWTKDPSVAYNGLNTQYMDYTGSVCPGRFRAMSNTAWWGDASIYSIGSGEWAPSGAFDKQAQGYVTTAAVTNTGQGSGGEGNVELVLQTPCSITLSEYKVTSRADMASVAANQSPAKMVVYGSTDSSAWTELGSYSGETSWGAGEVKAFSANAALGSFNYFKFDIRKVAGSSDYEPSVGDIELIGAVSDPCGDGTGNCHANATCKNAGRNFTCSCNQGFTGDGVSCTALDLIPPADIGAGDTWTKDSTVTYNSLPTFLKTYTGAVCPGSYTAKSNQDWRDNTHATTIQSTEMPPSGAFDGMDGIDDTVTGFVGPGTGTATNTGTDSGTDANLELIIQIPCVLYLHTFGVAARGNDGSSPILTSTPSKMTVSGSLDGSLWTEIGSFSGEITWEYAEVKWFSANSSLGPFSYFKFDTHQVASDIDRKVVIGDIKLYGDRQNECEDGRHNCDGNSTCTDTTTSFTCACNSGFFGDGVTDCTGRGDAWTKDDIVTHNGLLTLYKDYTGALCPGRYRARTNTQWWEYTAPGSFSAFEWPPSGAFDREPWGAGNKNGFKSGNDTLAGTSAASEENVEVILELPCFTSLHQYGVQSRDGGAASKETVSKAEIHGSTDLSTWKILGSFSGETSWGILEVKNFSADSTVGPFTSFKFVGQRVAFTDPNPMSIGEILLSGETYPNECNKGTHNCQANATCTDTANSFTCGCNVGFSDDSGGSAANGTSCTHADECAVASHNCHQDATCSNTVGSFTCACSLGTSDSFPPISQIPPTDIGRVDTWTKDTSVTFNSIYTIYKDYSGSVCAGRYRAKSNIYWFKGTLSTSSFDSGEWPPSGAFDGHIGGSRQGYHVSDVPNLGTASGTDATVELVLDIPCDLSLFEYKVRGRQDTSADWSPSKMTVYGSADGGTSWAEVGAFSGETSWTINEIKTFSANSTLGPFNSFKFHFQKVVASTSTNILSIGEIELHGHIDEDECSLNSHDCNQNATCADNIGSFECTCNDGWTGDGLTCSNEDECSLNSHDCHGNATCADNIGSFVCACNDGWSGSGVSCSNEDECSLNSHDCNQNATCADNIGSFECTCNDGWTGDGLTCSSE